ncbi:hypothetical protein ACFQE1_04330 [Halobium palmae]|uniref:Uncharacterized protein n=1 Tax=Halobium palmae TaxID=1776492 RepID=A0ABD5RWR7_9EURY
MSNDLSTLDAQTNERIEEIADAVDLSPAEVELMAYRSLADDLSEIASDAGLTDRSSEEMISDTINRIYDDNTPGETSEEVSTSASSSDSRSVEEHLEGEFSPPEDPASSGSGVGYPDYHY